MDPASGWDQVTDFQPMRKGLDVCLFWDGLWVLTSLLPCTLLSLQIPQYTLYEQDSNALGAGDISSPARMSSGFYLQHNIN